MSTKTSTPKNIWKLAAIAAIVLLICSMCANVILAFYWVNNTIRINELEGGTSIYE